MNLSNHYIPLIGVALGDALGSGVEGTEGLLQGIGPYADPGKTHFEAHENIGELSHPDSKEIGTKFYPYSPFGFKPGELTDDTQMTWAALTALKAFKELPRVDDISSKGFFATVWYAYQKWIDSKPIDVGNLTRQSLNQKSYKGGFLAWDGESAGNGSLMRASSSYVAGYRGVDLLKAAALDSITTHVDPKCVASCIWYVATLEAAQQLNDPLKFTEAAKEGLRVLEEANIIEWIGFVAELSPMGWKKFQENWKEAKYLIKITVNLSLGGKHTDCLNTNHKYWPTGYVVDSLEQAVWAASKFDTANESIRQSILHGGDDADTIGAIAGGLIGARFGSLALEQWNSKLIEELRMGHKWSAYPDSKVSFIDALKSL